MHMKSCKVLSEEPISSSEVQQRLREFLSKKHIKEGLSKDDYSRLRGLQRSLQHEQLRSNAEESMDT